MGMDSPFEEDEKQYFVADNIKGMSAREIEAVLKKTGRFSRSAVKILISRLDVSENPDDNQDKLVNAGDSKGNKEILDELKSMMESLKK